MHYSYYINHYDDDNFEYTELRKSTPVAKKEYRCYLCGDTIKAGEKHKVIVYKYEGKVYQDRYHYDEKCFERKEYEKMEREERELQEYYDKLNEEYVKKNS